MSKNLKVNYFFVSVRIVLNHLLINIKKHDVFEFRKSAEKVPRLLVVMNKNVISTRLSVSCDIVHSHNSVGATQLHRVAPNTACGAEVASGNLVYS